MSALAMPASASLGSSHLRVGALPPPLPVQMAGTRNFEEKPADRILAVSSMLTITVVFFITGVIGLLRPDYPSVQITLSGMAGGGQDDLPSQETTMAELLSQFDESTETVEEIVEIPVPQEVVPNITEDLPEETDALVTEDVFTVPAAQRVEEALKPIDPAAPKPKPQPRRATATKVSATRSSGTATGAATASGGGNGTGKTGTGGTGKMPKPPYPTYARSAGLQGTVRISLTVAPSGEVASTSVVGTCGSSRLDEEASSFIRRNWHFPPGPTRRLTVPIVYRLH